MFGWSPEETIDKEDLTHNITVSPRSAYGMGPMSGLTISMKIDRNENYCSFAVYYGWKVMIHTPHEYPLVSALSESVATRMETDMLITPRIVRAKKSVREIKRKNRKCHFQDEHFLAFYWYVILMTLIV